MTCKTSETYQFDYVTTTEYEFQLEVTDTYQFCFDKDDILLEGIGVWVIESTFIVQ